MVHASHYLNISHHNIFAYVEMNMKYSVKYFRHFKTSPYFWLILEHHFIKIRILINMYIPPNPLQTLYSLYHMRSFSWILNRFTIFVYIGFTPYLSVTSPRVAAIYSTRFYEITLSSLGNVSHANIINLDDLLVPRITLCQCITLYIPQANHWQL